MHVLIEVVAFKFDHKKSLGPLKYMIACLLVFINNLWQKLFASLYCAKQKAKVGETALIHFYKTCGAVRHLCHILRSFLFPFKKIETVINRVKKNRFDILVWNSNWKNEKWAVFGNVVVPISSLVSLSLSLSLPFVY